VVPGWHVVPVGRYPDGLVINKKSTVGYVHNGLDHTVMKLVGRRTNTVEADGDPIRVGSDVLPADVVEGRKLFFDASDLRLSSGTQGAACATCHLDRGQEDGHVWQLAEGPRQTTALAGGRLEGTAPFHWSGAFADFDALAAHTVARMGGTGLGAEQLRQLRAYLGSLPEAANPARRRPPSEAALRGEAVFRRAGCDGCHAGERLTDNSSQHVGTLETGFPDAGVNVPSLLGLARSAPYLHDGSAATLRERLMNGKEGDLHGKTSGLSEGDVDDLVAYLERL
jgi:cytochrome c peroxidase